MGFNLPPQSKPALTVARRLAARRRLDLNNIVDFLRAVVAVLVWWRFWGGFWGGRSRVTGLGWARGGFRGLLTQLGYVRGWYIS